MAAYGLNSLDATDGNEEPIFNVERVQLQFSLSADFVAAQVANNVLVLALATGRIMRIDLDNAADIEDIDLPRKSSEIGLIRRMFLDPSASHLIVNTTLGENFYLHSQSRQPKQLPRLKGVNISSIGWNPALPTASTREILIGAADGNIYETSIESQADFYRREEKYLSTVYKLQDGAVTGIWVDAVRAKSDVRRVMVGSSMRLLHFVGQIGRQKHEGLYGRLFEHAEPTVREVGDGSSRAPSGLAFSPDLPYSNLGSDQGEEKIYAWLSGQGVLYGSLMSVVDLDTIGTRMFNSSKLFSRSKIVASQTAGGRKKTSQEPISAICLTQWHVCCLVEGRVIAINRLDGRTVYDQAILEGGESALGLFADQKKNTFWLFTTKDIYELAVTNEDRDVWKIMLKEQKFDAALQYAQGDAQKDAVATASGDYLVSKGQYLESASVYGKSSKAFEEVALTFIDNDEQDALRKYLLTKIMTYKKNQIMQRMMIASWLVEVFMSKFNSLDDTITTKAELVEGTTTAETKDELTTIRSQFHDFVNRYKGDLDRKTTYDIISSHGREQELLTYATAVDDHNYILTYWIQRERWRDALDVLKRQSDPSIFYKYASVLMTHTPIDLVDILMRHQDLNPRKLIPALLNYAQDNQAARYLHYCIDSLGSTDAAVHNTLISIYAAHPTPSETELLRYLSSQSSHPRGTPSYDADFALRLCLQHNRVQACVHIYSLMSQYASAVSLALKHDEIDLAAMIADRPAESNPALRKSLWLAVAKKVISSQGTGSIKTAIDFLKRCDLLRIDDLIPFFPDFVVIDDFKDDICAALENYSRHIDALRLDMDESAKTAQSIKGDIKKLDQRYAIVQPGEGCRVCGLPLLSRQFFVFPSCQHAFHSDCLGKKVVEGSGMTIRNRIRELQASIGRGTQGPRREREVRELDGLVGKECILCSDYAIKLVEEPFVTDADNGAEWAI